MRKKRVVGQEIISKYLNLYNDLKMLFEKNIDINYYKILSKKNNTNPDFIGWLIKQGAILKTQRNRIWTYEWNNNIPVTEELIILYLNYKYEYNLDVRQKKDSRLFISKQIKLSHQNTISKYLKACHELKNKCDNKIEFNFNKEIIRLNISSSLRTFLRKNNIMNVDLNGFYKWNEKIPITNKLITSYINYKNEMSQQYYLEKQKPQETPTLFNSPSYIKDAIKETVTVVPEGKEKEFIERQQTKREAKQTVEIQNIGLIRRFIKWIY